MSVRDLDEMRAFKNSERLFLKRMEDSPVDQVLMEPGLKRLRHQHDLYIKGEAEFVPMTGQRYDVVVIDEVLNLTHRGD